MWTSKLGNKFSKKLINDLDSEHHIDLQQLRKQPANSRCAECGDSGTTWASVSIGVFLCVRCADVHRALGTHISKVKGCSGTYLWGPDEICRMKEMGNAWVNAAFGGDSAAARPAAVASKQERLEICRKKYEQCVWARPADTSQPQISALKHAREHPVEAVRAHRCGPSVKFADTNLLDDLFRDFSAQHEEETLEVHRPPQQKAAIVDVVTSNVPARPGELSLLDELFKNVDASSKQDSSVLGRSAALRERVEERQVSPTCVLESFSDFSSEVAMMSRHPHVAADVWAGFGSW